MSSSPARTAATGLPAVEARRESGSSRSATAPATRSRRLCARPSRPRTARRSRTILSSGLRGARTAGGRRAGSSPATRSRSRPRPSILAAGGRCYREAEERGELSTNHPGATGEVTQIARSLGAELRDFDALQYHPNGGAWPQNMQGYSIPETTRAYGAVLLNADREEFTDSLGPRDAVSQAIFEEVDAGRGVETEDGRPAVYLDTTRITREDAEISLPYMLRRYRAAGDRPPPAADPHVSSAPLPERRARDRRARRDDRRRPVRVRRDRRRHARAQSDDGQLAPRVLRLRTQGRACGRGKGTRMSTVATDLAQVVEDAAAHLYVWALKDIPQDLRDAISEARERETSIPGRRVLETIVRNVEVAEEEKNLVCQDTGIAVYTCRVGEHFPLHPARIYDALKAGTERATVEHSSALERRPHDHAREHRAEHGVPAADRPLGVHPRLGRARRQVRPQGIGLREHELPEDVRPRRRGEGDQAVRARVDRRRGRQAVPARDRRRRHRRLGRLCDVPGQGGDRASGGDEEPRSDRRRAGGRAVRPPEPDGDRPDGARAAT